MIHTLNTSITLNPWRLIVLSLLPSLSTGVGAHDALLKHLSTLATMNNRHSHVDSLHLYW